MTWGDLFKEIKRTLKEPKTDVVDSGHWTDAEYLRRANIGQRKIVGFTGCLKQTDITTVSVANQAEYSKPTNCLRWIRLTYDNKRLYPISRDDLDIMASAGQINSPWVDSAGTPTNYYKTFTTYGLYYKPDTADKIITEEYALKPTDLVNASSVPFNGTTILEDYQELIISYVIWRCLLEDEKDLFKEHKNDFIQGILNLKRVMNVKFDEDLGTFTLLKQRVSNAKFPLPLWG